MTKRLRVCFLYGCGAKASLDGDQLTVDSFKANRLVVHD